MSNKEERKQIYYKRLSSFVNALFKDGWKTDIDSQIKAIETLNEKLVETPLFMSIISSLKELRGIKRNKKQ
jgi:predicted site-specific integrase-resolvase